MGHLPRRRRGGGVHSRQGALSKLTPDLADRIPERGSIIAFRNVLIHGYAAVVDEIVWEVLEDDLPALRASAARLIEELPSGT
jgi:uncharacterized protein with HEPN domain